MLLEPLLATNTALIVGVTAMAEGTAPVPMLFPFALSAPVPRFTVKAETVVLPCAVTKRRPTPPVVTAELLLLQAIKQKSKTGSSRYRSKRNFIRILCPRSRFKISRVRAESFAAHSLEIKGYPHLVYQEYKGSANFVHWLEPQRTAKVAWSLQVGRHNADELLCACFPPKVHDGAAPDLLCDVSKQQVARLMRRAT